MCINKKAVFCLVCAMLVQSGAYALELGNVNENPITVSGKTEAGVSVAALVKDEENTYRFFDEITSDEKGNYSIAFKLPDNIKNKTVTVEMKPQGKPEEKISFTFSGAEVREEAKNAFLDAVSAKSEDELATVLENEDYITAFEMIGIPVSILKENKDVLEYAIKEICDNGTDSENFARDFAKYCYVSSAIKNKNCKEVFFEKADFEFDGKTYSEETDDKMKAWVKENMSEDEIDSVNAAEDEYKRICVYYTVNNAKYTDLPDLIEKYKKELGVSGTADYNKFKALSDKNKNKAAEAIVTASGFGKLTDGFDEYLKIGVDAIKENSNNSTSGGGGGGGNGGGGTSVMTGVVTPQKVTGEHTDENKAPEAETKTLFADVLEDAWYYQPVMSLNEKGIVAGKADGRYLPNDNVKREEFLAMLIRAAGKQDMQSETELTFADVASGAWYENTVKVAVELGITAGYNENTFGIGDLITRQDAAVFASRIAKLLGKELVYSADEMFADDADISDYAKESVYAMKNANIISGMGDNRYSPKASCTRAQAAVIVYKLLEGGNN